MTYVQSFSEVTPPPRYDAIAWTQVEIWESATATGTFVLIDTKAIPVDSTPDSPNTVQITTTLATLPVGWYRFRFKDGVPNYSNYTAPVLAPAGADGSTYFTVAELRARFPELTAVAYSDAKIDAVRATAEQAFEHAADVAFVPRTVTVTLSGGGMTLLGLPFNRVRSITAATVDGLAVDVTGAKIIPGGFAYLQAGWKAGTQNTVVTLSHGYDELPLEVKRAVMLLTRDWLIRGPIDSRATQMPTEGGGVINLATPGMFGAEFAIAEVDRVLQQYRWLSNVA